MPTGGLQEAMHYICTFSLWCSSKSQYHNSSTHYCPCESGYTEQKLGQLSVKKNDYSSTTMGSYKMWGDDSLG